MNVCGVSLLGVCLALAQKGRQAATAPRASTFVTGEKSRAVSVICTENVLHSGFSGTFSTRDPTWGNHFHQPSCASQTYLVTARKQKDKAFNFTFYGPHESALGLKFQGDEE